MMQSLIFIIIIYTHMTLRKSFLYAFLVLAEWKYYMLKKILSIPNISIAKKVKWFTFTCQGCTTNIEYALQTISFQTLYNLFSTVFMYFNLILIMWTSR